eukprot:TRINITY_DN5925_c0_g1_i2.p1 TRINITY_DN5925_c0_g1~~TRINITY_DN5925_c0_g1_i2.p1  ORF type:complete len:319 (-),score=26.54 TRINITY_DN5925_c0_g1_i2:55-1011(-)
MELWLLKVIILISLVLVVLIFAPLPLLFRKLLSHEFEKKFLTWGNCFAGGLFLAGGLVHLLAEANETFEEDLGGFYPDYPFAFILCFVGFAIAFFVEKVLLNTHHDDHKHSHPHEQSPIFDDSDTQMETKPMLGQYEAEPHHEHHHHHYSDHPSELVSYILLAVLSVHSVIAGLAIGVQDGESNTVALFIAVIAHKWVESFALGISILRTEMRWPKFLKIIAFYVTMVPIGIIIGGVLSEVISGKSGDVLTACLTAIASGTFLYVSIVDIIIEEFATSEDRFIKFPLLVFGFCSMASLLFAFDHNHGDEEDSHDHLLI